MGREKGSTNKIQTGISYPRKCSQCNYLSNNPAMFHYHKKTHDPIPVGQLCDFGCGQLATVKGTGGKYACLPITQQCPFYIKTHSERITDQWATQESKKRRQETKERFFKFCCGNTDAILKMQETKRLKFNTISPDTAKNYRAYARYLRKRAQQWARDQGFILGKQTYHVDHKLSIKDAWYAGLSAEIVNHPANLQVIEAKKNSSKGANSSLTVEELLKLISESS